mmetsp:Transcript_23796/g.60131  ORF Transcript_23796/g.60131 Transcript_23796/m.60131 type:complete len:105 (+) Transcript_23796:170-484(+)|eukprot:g2910.t1
MLDLMTLGLSIAAQDEIEKARKDTGASINEQPASDAESNSSTTTMMEAVAETVDSVLSSVESAASSMVSALTPSSEMVDQVMDSCTMEAPQVDLSLPTVPVSKK